MSCTTEQDLIFFNKNGDALNFNYSEESEMFEGKLFFDENSDDTYKSLSIFTFERIPSFEYELNDGVSDKLFLSKFQLFNEYGFDFVGNTYNDETPRRIDAVNADPTFFSKWVYGTDFERKYPKGSEIKITGGIAGFFVDNTTYTVVKTKKNAVMVLTPLNNKDYYDLYNSLSDDDFSALKIEGINSVQIRQYVDASIEPNLSVWSEPFFYDKLYVDQKLNFVNTDNNDGIFTVQENLLDNTNYTFEFENTSLSNTSSLIGIVELHTDVPNVYNGILTINGTDSIIEFPIDAPDLLRPGITFKINNAPLNNLSEYTVDSIMNFDLTPGVFYATASQVIWNGEIYDCVQSYTQSSPLPQQGANNNSQTPFLLDESLEITPDNIDYWQVSKFIPVVETLNSEYVINSEIYLTDNKYVFIEPYDQSPDITMNKFVENYSEDFNTFDINLNYSQNKVISELKYSSRYADVKFYNGDLSDEITTVKLDYEKVIRIKEDLNNESNRNLSEINEWSIFIDDLDEFGLRVIINDQEYYTDTIFVYSNSNSTEIDLEKTVDKTLRKWRSDHLEELIKRGLLIDLQYSGYTPSPYVNTIKLSTTYPNVPLKFSVQVGTTANYHIEREYFVIYEMSNVLNVTVNGILYTEEFDTDIATTLQNWVDNYSRFIFGFGIIVNNVNQVLYFNSLEQDDQVEIDINVGIDPDPGVIFVKNVILSNGNEGAIITSNSIVQNYATASTTFSFEDECFATGQILSLNNSYWVYNNTEYNVILLDPNRMVLSYQGPFWGSTQSDIENAFLGYSFDDGFGFDPDAPNITVPIVPDSEVNIFGSFSNLIDINYIQPVDKHHILSDDLAIIYDATNLTELQLYGITQSGIKLKVNPINQSTYILTETNVYVLDTMTDIISSSFSLPFTGQDMEINTNNGEIYISFSDSIQVNVYDTSNTFVLGIAAPFTNTDKTMTFDNNEDVMFISEGNNIIEIDGDTHTAINTYVANNVNSELYYNPFTNNVYGLDDTSLFKIDNGSFSYIPDVPSATFSSFAYSPDTDNMYISLSDKKIYVLDDNDTLISDVNVFDYGYLEYSNYDAHIYIASNLYPRISVFSTVINNTFVNVDTTYSLNKIVYNQYRQSVIGISDDKVIEVKVNALSPKIRAFSNAYSFAYYSPYYSPTACPGVPIEPLSYGTLADAYCEDDEKFLLLKTREYLRRPRANYETLNEPNVNLTWKWEDDQTPEMFIYDVSGEFLTTNGPLAYTGDKPLPNPRLNRKVNTDINRINMSEFQKTIFDETTYQLEYIDSSTDISIIPEAIPLYMGFKSMNEGVEESTLLLTSDQDIEFTINVNDTNMNIISYENMINNDGTVLGKVSLDVNSTEVFTDKYLKVGQLLKIKIKDNQNDFNQYISYNNGRIFKIKDVYPKEIILEIINDELIEEKNIIYNYPGTGMDTYLSTTFEVVERIIAKVRVFGQTEIEDIRYKIELNNTGKNIAPDDVYIFKEYDINEQGIDWTYLNRKRKEMLYVRNDIYNYIGSYRSIINAINFFGYNDLELFEYYQNINRQSENFGKLIKIEIPDIFDPSVEGWTENAFVLNTFPNANYDITNMFNLTFNITDKDGCDILDYSLEEVLIKLQGLKRWLSENIIPLSHKILDITGQAHTVGNTYIQHETYKMTNLECNNNLSPIDFTIPESYVMPVNSGSTVYNTVIEFTSENEDYTPDYYNVKIRTYAIYDDWMPFQNYMEGDDIRYLGKLYTSIEDNNKTNNPTEYSNVNAWNANYSYNFGDIVGYESDYYQYQIMGTPSSVNSTPPKNNTDWFRINEWREIPMIPVQTIDEYRLGDDLRDMLFTVDTNIDPYVIIEVTSDNGYGGAYTTRKSVELRYDADSSEILLDN